MRSLLDNPGIRDAVLRLDIEQYHQLCGSGIIPERTELLEGIVLEKMGKSSVHTWTVGFLEEWIRAHLPDHLYLRVEQPLTMGESEPEPDLALIEGHRGLFRELHPTSAILVVEVAITTIELDRAKAEIYARDGVPQYLLVLPKQQQLQVYDGLSEGRYQSLRTATKEDSIVMNGLNDATLALANLFP
jgi:Uma2 family endonuclease